MNFMPIVHRGGRLFWKNAPVRWWEHWQRLFPQPARRFFVATWNTVACRVLGHEHVEMMGECSNCRYRAPDYDERHAAFMQRATQGCNSERA